MTNSVRKGWFGRKFLLAVTVCAAMLGARAAVKNVWYTVDDSDPVNGKNWSRVSGWSISGGTLGKLPGAEEIATFNSEKTTLENGPLVISEGAHTPRAVTIANSATSNYKKDGRRIWLKMTGGLLRTSYFTDSGYNAYGAQSFSIGDHADGYGVFTMEGGVVSNRMVTVGYNGYGVMTNAGGTVYLHRGTDTSGNANLTLGYQSGSTGLVVQTAGEIRSLIGVNGRLQIGHNNGYGRFDLLGGSIKGQVLIGSYDKGHGEMTVGNGATIDGSIQIGVQNSSYGKMTLSGGTLDIGDPTETDSEHYLRVGSSAGSTGVFEYKSGQILVSRCFVGNAGNGTLLLNGKYAKSATEKGVDNWFLGYKEGSFGRMVLNAEYANAANSRGTICAGVYGDGEAEFNENMTIGYLKVAGGPKSCGSATLAANKTLTISSNVNLGGYPLPSDSAKVYPDLTGELDGGHGELRLNGGTLKLTKTDGGTTPLVFLGRYGKGFGRLTGFGTIAPASSGATNVRLGIGNGQVIADGGTLDLNAVVDSVNQCEQAADTTNGWYAVNGGSVRLPRSWFKGTDVVSKCLGTDQTAKTANLVGSVAYTLTPKASYDQNFVRCSLYAEDADTVKDKLATLPSKTVLGVWRAGVFAELDNSSTKRDFKDISLTFHYDWTKLGGNATSERVSLWRHDGTSWTRVGRATYTKGELSVISTATALAPVGDSMNIGTFAVTKDKMGLLLIFQ